MLPPNLIPLIEVTFSTPTDVHINNPKFLLKKDGIPHRDDAFPRDFREHELFGGAIVTPATVIAHCWR
jgi:hypothetical protein